MVMVVADIFFMDWRLADPLCVVIAFSGEVGHQPVMSANPAFGHLN